MFKFTNEFDTAVYNLLAKIRDSESPQEKPSDMDKYDFDDIIEFIVLNHLAKGIKPLPNDGYSFASDLKSVRITRQGLFFIENFKA